jgi:Na+-transporting methylmalonyl-CoA/oxaloacetate decarboxylase beta subunit
MLSPENIGLLLQGITHVTPQSLVMIAVALGLLYLGVVKQYEPLLLLPIGAGCLLANLPLSPLIAEDGMLRVLYNMGIVNELFPLLIFIGIGALTDFGPLLENPRLVLLGAAGQFGIFPHAAAGAGFRLQSQRSGLDRHHRRHRRAHVHLRQRPARAAPAGPITVAAYSYMSLVPIILPPIMKLLTTQKGAPHPHALQPAQVISRRTRILFPIVVTVLVGTLVPFATPLIGMLMLGNLMKESGVVERLTKASSNEIANTVTLFLGLAIGSTMVGSEFLKLSTLAILVLGILAFAVDAITGVLFAKLLNVLSGGKVNPLVGAAGISAFPMAARVVQKVAQEEDFENFLLMHAMGANAAGQVASVVAGGVLLALMGAGG